MSNNSLSALETYLAKFEEAEWLEAVESLLPCIHEVDQNAVQIWFRFYPLSLHRLIESATDRDEVVRGLALQGDFELKDQIATSHHFLYGHRYWGSVRTKILAENENFKDEAQSLVDEIKLIGMRVSEKQGVDRQLVNAIAAVGLMTLNQVGLEAFADAPAEVEPPAGIMKKSPDAIVTERKTDDSQGLFGFLKTVDKQYSINYSNGRLQGKFKIVDDQQIASASAGDTSRNWKEQDPRCWEGVVPVECLSASCGTCWVGVLGGQEKLSEVKRLERRSMKVFGYNQPQEEKPFLRLACQARASGNTTIVIPPWNGVFGKKVYANVEELELEPVTTSAQELRKAVASSPGADKNESPS
jgi:ferredoxin